ncbi:MAG: hypothetical protein HC767_00535 [Akkermansiaceae bacterium]|nr:hypothetical protein [Akkermansiaceae bacterium]
MPCKLGLTAASRKILRRGSPKPLKNFALDALRREQNWQHKETQITTEQERWLTQENESTNEGNFADSTLRLIFVCIHPQLAIEAQLALALRIVCGLSPAEIAAAFLTREAAISKRLVRARQQIRELRLPLPCRIKVS